MRRDGNTRFDATEVIARLGHRPGDWSPIGIPGDVSNGYIHCTCCGRVAKLGSTELKGNAIEGLCTGPSTSVQEYMWNMLGVKSNRDDLEKFPINSIVGECSRWVIDAAFRLMMEPDIEIPDYQLLTAIVHAVEVYAFG